MVVDSRQVSGFRCRSTCGSKLCYCIMILQMQTCKQVANACFANVNFTNVVYLGAKSYMHYNYVYNGSKLVLPQFECNCGLNHSIPDMDIYVGSGILSEAAHYIGNRLSGKNILLVADNNTYAAAGAKAKDILSSGGYSVICCIISRDGEMDPDQSAIGEIMLSFDAHIDFLLAVGSGSICDITRYAAYCLGKPFAIIGTAPSMDGYTSINSSLVYNTIKISKYTKPSEVIICDTEIMKKAPYPMFISGFGDLLGKYIARADWTMSGYVNNEPVCIVCIDLIMQAVQKCISSIEGIKNRTEEGTKNLIEALLLSGLTILIIANSRAVASNDHNMAHVWEMIKLGEGGKPPSHGMSVGVATLYCLKFYEEFFKLDFNDISVNTLHAVSPDKKESAIRSAFGEKIAAYMISGNTAIHSDEATVQRRVNAFYKHKHIIRQKVDFLPTLENAKGLLDYLDAPTNAAQLGISDKHLASSLLYTKDLRSRYNLFNLAEEMGVLQQLARKIQHL